MNCAQARDLLPGLLYEDLEPEQATMVDNHRQGCPVCQKEFEQLKGLRHTMNVLPVPALEVNVPLVMAQAARLQARKLRRWRRLAAASLAAAAVLMLSFGSRLEIRIQANQLTVRWNNLPSQEVPNESLTAQPSPSPVVSAEDMQLVKDLIHALAGDVEGRDLKQQQTVAELRVRLQALQWQANERCNATERELAALYLALRPRDQGEKR